MNTFRRRNKKITEYSGYNEASLQLRNRLINCTNRYIGQPHPYSYGLDSFRGIYKSSLNETLDNEYGVQNSDYISHLKDGNVEDVFTTIEIIFKLGFKQLDRSDFIELIKDLMEAFDLSNSVYEINKDGQIVLKLDDNIQEEIHESTLVIDKFEEAKKKYKDATAKLISRNLPEEVVKDAYLSLEMFLKAKTNEKGKNAFDASVNILFANKQIQREVIKKLKGFKGNAKGISHDGNYVIDEQDAIWYLRSIGAIFSLVEYKRKQV